MAQKVERHYEGSDNYMTGRCRVIHALYLDDLTAITAFDNDYDAGYGTAWLAEIDAAEAASSDESVQDQQRQLTEAVEAAWKDCRDAWPPLKYRIEKAFASDGKRREFGTDDYEKARKTQDATLKFMRNLETKIAVTADHAALLAAGATSGQLSAVATMRTALETTDTAQEAFKKSRLKDTEDRINILNPPYDRLVAVCALAQLAFADSEAKQKQYVYNPTSHPSPTDFSGDVAPGETKLVGTISYVAGKTLNFTNTGGTSLQFNLRVDEGLPGGTPFSLAAGGAASHVMSDLNDDPSATKLVVTNADPGQAGGYHVVVVS